MSKKSIFVTLDKLSGDYHFEGLGSDKIAVSIDAAAAIGGTNLGARPMELLLMGLGGCSAIDVVMILKKSKQVIEDLKITIEGERDAEAIPAPFEKIHIKFWFKGDLKANKIEEAIRLSMEKYCSAAVMLSKTAVITWSYAMEEG